MLILVGILVYLKICTFPVRGHIIDNNQLTGNKNIERQIQKSSINLDATDLKAPNLLKITKQNILKNTSIKGEIRINGKIIKEITKLPAEVNLSPYLQLGDNLIEIYGTYSPSNLLINVEFLNSNTSINQSASGNGKLNQQLIISIND